MPNFTFENDYGMSFKTMAGRKQYAALDEFTRGFIEALFFSETGSPEDDALEVVSFEELAPEALEKIQADCLAFAKDNQADLEAAQKQQPGDCTARRAGADFCYTRNGHGTGFWDGDWPEPIGERLTQAAHAYSELNLYRGDDQLIYV
jgi:hypothetical protein